MIVLGVARPDMEAFDDLVAEPAGDFAAPDVPESTPALIMYTSVAAQQVEVQPCGGGVVASGANRGSVLLASARTAAWCGGSTATGRTGRDRARGAAEHARLIVPPGQRLRMHGCAPARAGARASDRYARAPTRGRLS